MEQKKLIKILIITSASIVGFSLVYLFITTTPPYKVWEQRLVGMAELQRAYSNRQIKVLESQATQEAAKHLAMAEVERAQGVAQANKVIGDSLKNNEAYLRYLWIHNLGEGKNEVVYVPTEANLPILEAGKRRNKE